MPPAPDSSSASLKGIGLVSMAWAIWSLDPIAVVMVGKDVPRLVVSSVAALAAAVALSPSLVRLFGRWKGLRGRDRWVLLAQCLLFTALADVCYVSALLHLHPGVVSAVLRSQVGIAVVLAILFLRERLRWASGAGVLIIVAANIGVLAISLAKAEGGASPWGWPQAFGAALLWAGGTVAGKHLLTVLRPSELIAARQSLSGAAVLVAALCFEGTGVYAAVTLKQWTLLAAKGVCISGLAYVLYSHGLKLVPVYVASAIEPLASVSTTLIAVFFLDQAISRGEAVCVASLLLGAFVVIVGSAGRRAAPRAPALGAAGPPE